MVKAVQQSLDLPKTFEQQVKEIIALVAQTHERLDYIESELRRRK